MSVSGCEVGIVSPSPLLLFVAFAVDLYDPLFLLVTPKWFNSRKSTFEGKDRSNNEFLVHSLPLTLFLCVLFCVCLYLWIGVWTLLRLSHLFCVFEVEEIEVTYTLYSYSMLNV